MKYFFITQYKSYGMNCEGIGGIPPPPMEKFFFWHLTPLEKKNLTISTLGLWLKIAFLPSSNIALYCNDATIIGGICYIFLRRSSP